MNYEAGMSYSSSLYLFLLIEAASCGYYRREDWREEIDARNKLKVFPSTEADYKRKLELRVRMKKPTMEVSCVVLGFAKLNTLQFPFKAMQQVACLEGVV